MSSLSLIGDVLKQTDPACCKRENITPHEDQAFIQSRTLPTNLAVHNFHFWAENTYHYENIFEAAYIELGVFGSLSPVPKFKKHKEAISTQLSKPREDVVACWREQVQSQASL